jgi:hypothetical protein
MNMRSHVKTYCTISEERKQTLEPNPVLFEGKFLAGYTKIIILDSRVFCHSLKQKRTFIP